MTQSPFHLSKGQVIIPKPIREARQWNPGQRLEVIESDEGILLKPAEPFPATSIADVAGCLPYKGKPKTLAEMEEAIAQAIDLSRQGLDFADTLHLVSCRDCYSFATFDRALIKKAGGLIKSKVRRP